MADLFTLMLLKVKSQKSKVKRFNRTLMTQI